PRYRLRSGLRAEPRPPDENRVRAFQQLRLRGNQRVPDLQEVRTVTSEAPPLSRAAGLNQQTGEYGSPQSLGRRPIGRRLLKRDTWPFQESLNGGQGLGAGGRGKVALAGGCFAWATAATEVK